MVRIWNQFVSIARSSSFRLSEWAAAAAIGFSILCWTLYGLLPVDLSWSSTANLAAIRGSLG